jgi:GcrA cell cycle regulator
MEWNDETIVRLRSLWNEGLSTAEIGRRLAVSKNAVVGKAHRLGLAARPSPIRRDGARATPSRPAAPRRLTGPTLPPLATSPVPEEGRPELRAPELRADVRPAPPAPVAEPQPAAPASAAAPQMRAMPARRSRLVVCCWPIGEPGTKSFRFCDEEAMTGKPYCAAHAQLAYVKVRDRREEAAA